MSRCTWRAETVATLTSSLVISVSAALFLLLADSVAPALHAVSRQAQSPAVRQDDEKVAKEICTPCHKFAPPDILPKNRWRSEVAKMMFIMRAQPQPPDLNGVTLPDEFAAVDRYMEAHAPEHLAAPERWPDPSESPVTFTPYGLSVPDMPRDPGVSNVTLVDFDGDGTLDVLGTEMKQGTVFWGHLQPGSPLEVIASVPNPDHVTLTDVDKDGVNDLLVADLGRFLPGDHHDGAIVWMRGLGHGKFADFSLEGCRVWRTWRRRTSTATGRTISRWRPSGGEPRGMSRYSKTTPATRCARRSRNTSSIRGLAPFTWFPSI